MVRAEEEFDSMKELLRSAEHKTDSVGKAFAAAVCSDVSPHGAWRETSTIFKWFRCDQKRIYKERMDAERFAHEVN